MSTHHNDVPLAATGHLPPTSLASASSGQTTGAWVSAAKARAFLAYCYVSTFAAGTATFSFKAATNADGAGAAAITGSGTLVLSAAGYGVLELPASLVPAAAPYISITCTTAGGTNVCGGILVALDPMYR
jgi:hypothetical protein